jgi:YD repeat-containing protein
MRPLLLRLILISSALCAQALTTVHADSQRVLQYEYDGAGNIVRIVAADNLAPPTVGSLNPSFIDQGAQAMIIASGTNLAGVDVSTSASGLTVLDVAPISDTQVRFTLRADPLTPLALADLVFTTVLGSTTAAVLIAEPLPIISSVPNPIALSVVAPPVPVVLVFDAPFAEDRTFQFSVQNPAIATVSESSIVMPAGAVQVVVTLDGLALGTTSLDVTEQQRFRAVSVPVFISDATLVAGSYGIRSANLGVVMPAPPAARASDAASPLLGVVMPAPPAARISDVVSQPLGVVVVTATLRSAEIASQSIGVAVSPVADSLLPASVGRGTSTMLTLSGHGLGEVSAVNFRPDDGVTITGPLLPSIDGSELQVPITVAADASLGTRAITLSGPQGTGAPDIVLEISP